MQRVFGITGWKNSGKTGLTVRVVEELTKRGWRISTIKHAHHAFDIDHEGTDSFRHREAGATEVAIVSSNRWALMHELRTEEEPNMDTVLARLEPCDLVIIEGYKREGHPKIEARRREAHSREPLAGVDSTVVAIATDEPDDSADIPIFDLNDTNAITDFIEVQTGLAEVKK
ncbi:molybdopterin-guanine dinucleotide biosynthesis protein B [Hoeflea prorocentri]|uniref:Molybdopterin-guanine dinucleotide biosynthesis protein B n=1 Tax=Hoeflea prorocentri TaxID=1922333 RepID=A0A9X3ZH04_9HYPH|nr:molybdopterin-guanine dinucleotide biosynthesis protein B [Hoeflea prorocentri]MCY6380280.1 molybdopterin-guanine dinucleotide biosynthesis protein B [Hoeflea prorocentri]MDA5398080.1 molybdopterin-guanine dinucleotide biosynthesis protein B [Hoeflea prorocentri]